MKIAISFQDCFALLRNMNKTKQKNASKLVYLKTGQLSIARKDNLPVLPSVDSVICCVTGMITRFLKWKRVHTIFKNKVISYILVLIFY